MMEIRRRSIKYRLDGNPTNKRRYNNTSESLRKPVYAFRGGVLIKEYKSNAECSKDIKCGAGLLSHHILRKIPRDNIIYSYTNPPIQNDF